MDDLAAQRFKATFLIINLHTVKNKIIDGLARI